MRRFTIASVRSGCVSEIKLPKVSLLTISIIFATGLSSNLSKMSSKVKWVLRHFVLETQIEPVSRRLETILLSLGAKFLGCWSISQMLNRL
jgi:hypothetical protein